MLCNGFLIGCHLSRGWGRGRRGRGAGAGGGGGGGGGGGRRGNVTQKIVYIFPMVMNFLTSTACSDGRLTSDGT